MTRIIPLFEHQYRSYNGIGIESSDLILHGIEEVNAASGAEIIQLLRKGIRTTQYVGVVQINDTSFQILPKIDYDPSGELEGNLNSTPHDRACNSAARNLLYLLSYAYNFSFRDTEIAGISGQRSDWFEFLTRLFATDLHKKMQQGIEHNYLQIEEELPVMKGRWQIEKQIRRKPFIKHRFDVIYDEFSPDTPLNRVFRYVIEKLLLITQDAQNRSLLLDLRDWLLPVSRQVSFTADQLDHIQFSRLNERFLPAFNFARLFIESSTISLSSGMLQTFAFVLDMNQLFEAFFVGFLQRHRSLIFPEDWDNTLIHPQSQGKTYYLAQRQPGLSPAFKLKPDILFTKPSGYPILILDTKYKKLDHDKGNRGISESDVYQMLAYETRMNCKNTLVIYPASNSSISIRERLKFYNDTGDVLFATINLHRDLSKPDSLIEELKILFSMLTTD